MRLEPTLLFSIPIAGRVVSGGDMFAAYAENSFSVFDGTGRRVLRWGGDEPILSVSLRGGGGTEGHVLTRGRISRFTRRGVLSPFKVGGDVDAILDEHRGGLLVTGGGRTHMLEGPSHRGVWSVDGAYSHGRMNEYVILCGPGLVVLDGKGAVMISLDGEWRPLFSDEPVYLSDRVMTFKNGALVGGIEAPPGTSVGAAFSGYILLADAAGHALLYDGNGNVVWQGDLPGTVVGHVRDGVIVARDGVVAGYGFIGEGKKMMYEILCRNPRHCGTFVSHRYLRTCPICGGDDIVVRRQIVDKDRRMAPGPTAHGEPNPNTAPTS